MEFPLKTDTQIMQAESLANIANSLDLIHDSLQEMSENLKEIK